MNAISQERLRLVYPDLARRIWQIDSMAPELALEVTQGWRTWAEQDALFNQVPKVTEVRGGYSWHNFGLACDVAPFSAGQPDWNIAHPDWARIVSLGNTVGLFSGSLWRTFPDYPHLQLTGRFPDAPTDEVRAIYSQRGSLEDVWVAAFDNEITV